MADCDLQRCIRSAVDKALSTEGVFVQPWTAQAIADRVHEALAVWAYTTENREEKDSEG